MAHPIKSYDERMRTALENATLKRQLAQLTEDIDDLKQDKRSYRASKDRAEAHLGLVEAALSDAKDEIDQLRTELEKERNENACLRKKMEEESQEDSKWFVMVEMLQSKVAVRMSARVASVNATKLDISLGT